MFTKNSDLADAHADQGQTGGKSARGGGAPSILSADLKIIGDLHSSGDIQVEGSVEGDIKSQTVTVGEGAQITGSIHAETVRIGGTLNGQVRAPSVTIAKTAKVNGDIIHETLVIEAGAYMEGQCRRIDSEKRAAKEPRTEDFKPAPSQKAAKTAPASDASYPGGPAGKPAAR